jgi:hypothetical protein
MDVDKGITMKYTVGDTAKVHEIAVEIKNIDPEARYVYDVCQGDVGELGIDDDVATIDSIERTGDIVCVIMSIDDDGFEDGVGTYEITYVQPRWYLNFDAVGDSPREAAQYMLDVLQDAIEHNAAHTILDCDR